MGAGVVGVLAFAAALSGCGGGDSGGGPDIDGGASDAASSAGLSGQLVGPDDQPLANVEILACQATTCAYGESQADGRFAFAIEPPAEVALKTHADLTQSPRLAAALEPVDIVAGEAVEVGTLYIPNLPDGAVLAAESEDPQQLEVGDGLELTLNRADITPAIGDFLYDVAARRIPDQHIPPYPELDGEEVIAVYAMHPFAAESASPIAVRAPTDLEDGTPVKFRTISELDGNFSEPAPGAANGGQVSTDPGVGITRITYLVITR
ncbi:MAG: hypothetical protein Tsb0020_25830 [Haliangiales bacterium]